MKSFIAGVLTIIILGILGFVTFKATTKFMRKLTPSPSISASPSLTPYSSIKPSSKPSAEPMASTKPTTKGGLPIKSGIVKGVITTTTSHLTLTLVKTSTCPINYMTEIKDIKGSLTLRYELIDNTSFGITIWNNKGEELLQNTTYSGRSGTIKTISGVDYMKVRVESKSCASNNDNWLRVIAER